MSFTKWKVTRYCERPIEFTFKKETDHFFTNGRVRETKHSLRHKFFDTEQEALGYMAQREANKVEQKRLDHIRLVAPELLEALELWSAAFPGQRVFIDNPTATKAHAAMLKVIAKARGEGV